MEIHTSHQWTLSDKKGGSKTASFTYGDQVNGNHICTIPTPFVARAAKHRISRGPLWLQSCCFHPNVHTSQGHFAYTYRAAILFVQYNHINMQSTDIAQQAMPMLAHTLARASPSELSSSMHSSISSKSTPYEPSYIHKMICNMSLTTQKMIWNSAYWTC